jgi:hypothetical protein
MVRSSTERPAVFVLLAVLVFALGGCWNPFDPGPGPIHEIPEIDYHDRLTPEDVIHNLQTAYVDMNADKYLDCLSEDFTFYPTDEDVQNPNNGIPPEWGKDVETSTHRNMFADASNVESISLTLTEITSEHIEGIPDDPMDDIYVYRVGVDLRVNLLNGVTLLATAPSEYWFRVDQDQPDDPDVIWWEIYLWYDDPVRGRTVPLREPEVGFMSLAELRSFFRE